MSIIAAAVIATDVEGSWEVRHREGGSTIHNHQPIPASSLAGHRRREIAAHKQAILTDRASGARAAQTLASIYQGNPESVVVAKDLYNVRLSSRRDEFQTATPVEALFKAFDNTSTFYRYELESSNELKSLLSAQPDCIQIWKENPDVILLDCTYKTNRYNMPLLNIVGVSGMNTTVPIALALLAGEKEGHYQWALQQLKALIEQEGIRQPTVFIHDREQALINALEDVFPGHPALLCRWHMNKCVLSFARRHYGQVPTSDQQKPWEDCEDTNRVMELYRKCVEAKNEPEFERSCQILDREYPTIARYMDTTWWPYKDRCVAAWCNNHLHFGNEETSRVEGWHAHLKKWLQNSRSDIYTLFTSLGPWFQQSLKAYQNSKGNDLSKSPQSLQKPFFHSTVRIIHRYALFEVDKLLRQARQELVKRHQSPGYQTRPCTGSYRASLGRPCLHEVIRLLESDQALTPAQFHRHWHIDKEQAPPAPPPRVLEPRTIPKKQRGGRAGRAGRARQTGTGIHGNRRDPTIGERCDRNHPSTPPPPPATAPARVNEQIVIVEPLAARQSTPALAAAFRSILPRPVITQQQQLASQQQYRPQYQQQPHRPQLYH